MEWLDTALVDSSEILVAGILGAIVGFERELAGKPAGLRTHIFVCAGSALLMLLGHSILDVYQSKNWETSLTADPLRVVQAIVVGISFLGTGTIIRDGSHGVEGLTTAASIFFTCGIGIAVALGRYDLAIGATVFVVAVLFVLGRMEKHLQRLRCKYQQSTADDPECQDEDDSA